MVTVLAFEVVRGYFAVSPNTKTFTPTNRVPLKNARTKKTKLFSWHNLFTFSYGIHFHNIVGYHYMAREKSGFTHSSNDDIGHIFLNNKLFYLPLSKQTTDHQTIKGSHIGHPGLHGEA